MPISVTLEIHYRWENPLQGFDQSWLHRGASENKLTTFVAFHEVGMGLFDILSKERLEYVSERLESLVVRILIESLTLVENDHSWIDVARGVISSFIDRVA